MPRLTRTTLLATAALTFAAPSAADAAFTGDGTTLTGDGADDSVVITVEDRKLAHDITGGGFASKFDFNSSAAGEQTLSNARPLTINTGGGNDTVVGQRAPSAGLNINGGDGDDTLTGSRNTDAIDGGDGDDRIDGGQSNGSLRGGPGADTFVLGPFDVPSTIDGGTGDDDIQWRGSGNAEVRNLAAATGTSDPTAVRVTGGALPSVSTAVERLSMQAGGGDDEITVDASIGTRIGLTVDGGGGNDTIEGTPGGDQLTGGTGTDTIDGGGGDDVLFGRDGEPDTLDCGAGDADAVQADAPSRDATINCEIADLLPEIVVIPPAPEEPAAPEQPVTLATPPAPAIPAAAPAAPAAPVAPPAPAKTAPAKPSVRIGALRDRKRKGRHTVRFTVSCPAGTTTCRGKVRLTTAAKVRIGRKRARKTLGTATFAVKAGTRKTVTAKLAKDAGRFAKKRKLRLRVTVGRTTVTRTVTLRK